MVRFSLVLALLFAFGCNRPVVEAVEPPPQPKKGPTFAEEVAFLQEYTPVTVLTSPEGGRIAVTPNYQGRVMTSAVDVDGESLGWINHSFIRENRTGTQFDNYGGEDRFWLGPEGGQYGFYFPPDNPFVFSNWQVPPALNSGEWRITDQTSTSITFQTAFQLTNYSGTRFDMGVERTVRLLSKSDVGRYFGFLIPDNVKWVGFESVNQVRNAGAVKWTPETGLPSIWILGQFNPFDTTYVAVPFEGGAGESIVKTDYFGSIPADRIEHRNGYVLFQCDGFYRSKIGVGPRHARPYLGSYTESLGLLTIVQFNGPDRNARYVNSSWEIQQSPYSGDVVNSYNDGPTEPGAPPLGGFYELETSSPALELAPGERYTHAHRTLHLVGPIDALDPIARNLLGARATVLAAGIR